MCIFFSDFNLRYRPESMGFSLHITELLMNLQPLIVELECFVNIPFSM